MKRRNAECGKLRRPMKRNKISDGVYGSVLTYIKFFLVWAIVLMADFMLDFRFEYLWPMWLVLRSIYDSFKYQGLAFSIFFVCVTITSDVVCYLLIPVQWLFFTASTYVWVQYVWQTERGVCLPTILLWLIFLYIEIALRLRDLRTFPFQLELCRPFAAHCVGYPVITMGFSFKSCISYRFRLRKQREVQKANNFYYELLDQALPPDVVQNNRLRALPANSTDEVVANGFTVTDSSTSINCKPSSSSVRVDSNGWVSTSRDGRPPDNSVDESEFFERSINGPDDDDSDESGSSPVGGDTCRPNGAVKSNSRPCSGSKEPASLPVPNKKGKSATSLNVAGSAGRDGLLLTTKLEADIKRLKADLQSSRCTEQELRSQINSLNLSDRSSKAELSQLRQENDTLQTKLHKMSTSRQQDKQQLAILERRLQEERKQKTTLEQQLATEKQRRRTDDSVAAAARTTARSSECMSEQCKTKRTDMESEMKMLHRELQTREDRLRVLERETQALHQKRGESQSETKELISALGAIKDKNVQLETSLSSENRVKLELFSALGDAKRQIEIREGMLMQKERELVELRSKLAEMVAFLPTVPLTSFPSSSSTPVRYSPSYTTVGGLHDSATSEPETSTSGSVTKSTLNPTASDYTPKITQ